MSGIFGEIGRLLRPDSAPHILLSTSLVVLIGRFVARFKLADPPTLEEDVLSAAESASYEAANPRPPSEETEVTEPDDPDPSEFIDWNEQEDVYQPELTDADTLVRSLSLQQPLEIEEERTYIFLRRQAYETIQTHLRSNLEVEQGGLLIGRALLDSSLASYLLLIENALPALEGIETSTSFHYTPDSWKGLTPQLQQMDTAWTVIGSYHSHPGMGVFLSATDKETQAAVFSQDWQLALVVDPVKDSLGFFVGKSGTQCDDWHLVE